jgi:PAS domain S-box-containing protein
MPTTESSISDLKVLLLEDSFLDVELITEYLHDSGFHLELTHVLNEADYSSALQQPDFDVILSDFKLHGFDAFLALELRNTLAPGLPFICVSGGIGEDNAVDLLKKGADDYVLKDRLGRLPFAIRRVLDEVQAKRIYSNTVERLRLLNRAVEASSVSVVITDVNGLISYVNPFFLEKTGYSYPEVIGKSPRLLKSGYQPVTFYQELWQTILSRRDWHGEFQNKTKRGELYWEKAVISPIVNSDGVLTHFVAIKEDITERKKLLDELIASKEKAEESDRLKTAFIQNISHEIKTPLNGIVGLSQLLLNQGISQEEREEMVDFVEHSSQRLIKTITDYMDMAMIVSHTMNVHTSQFRLSPILEELAVHAHLRCAEKGIQYSFSINESISECMVDTDPVLLKKIVEKLLDNAIKFTSQGRVRCWVEVNDTCVNFYVSDTGIGIESAQLDFIFKVFTQEDHGTTRKYEGNGLGLAIAKGLAKLLQGNIHVVSARGEGSVFTLSLPTSILATGTTANLN